MFVRLFISSVCHDLFNPNPDIRYEQQSKPNLETHSVPNLQCEGFIYKLRRTENWIFRDQRSRQICIHIPYNMRLHYN